jgi:hypothetical protein
MVRHRLVRVHDAAGKELINEKIVRLEPFNTIRGSFDALELYRPLLEVKVCMLADTPIARATSIPISDFDEAVDDIVKIMAQINVPDPMAYVFVADSEAPPAAAAPPAEAHPLMALGQSAYRRNQVLTEEQMMECFEPHTARGMHAREVAMHLQACGAGFCSSDDQSLRKKLFIAIVRVFWNVTPRLLKILGPDIASCSREVKRSFGYVKHLLGAERTSQQGKNVQQDLISWGNSLITPLRKDQGFNKCAFILTNSD